MPANPTNQTGTARSPKPAKRPGLAPASRYEVLAPSGLPGMEMQDARLLPLDLIDHNPYQARQAFEVEALQELADSIREHGVLEPILVRPADADGGREGRYEIVAGERRYRAAAMAEQETIPARIMEMDQKQAAIITALENLQREDLDIEDEARQFAYLCEALEVSQRELAKMLGKNPVYISRRIRLLKRPDLLEEYRAGRLTLHQAAALAEPSPEENEVGAPPESDSAGITLGADDRDSQSDSAGITSVGSEGMDESQEHDVQLELIEREDLPGFIVARSGSGSTAGSGESDSRGITRNAVRAGRRPMFRWRPLQQFSNWVGRTNVSDIPADERATVRAQLTNIKEALEKQLAELEQLEKGS